MPERVPPETKDWTWVLQQRCPQCSLDAGALTLIEIPMVIRTQVQVWPVVLLRRDVAERPDPQVWSPLEYGAHTRDVLRLFQERLARMLAEDEPTLDDWDPNEAALQGGYHDLDADTVSAEILTEAETLATVVEELPEDAAERRGLRSDGAAFTVTTLMQYLVHDLVHHLWDVTHDDIDEAASQSTADEAEAPVATSAHPPAEDGADTLAQQVRGVDSDGGGGDQGEGEASQTPAAPLSAPDDLAETGGSAAGEEEGGTPQEPPIQAFANRHRRLLGIVMTIVAVALAVLDVTVLPQPDHGGGIRAFVLRWAAPVCWMMIAGVALTWALSVRRAIVNSFAYVAVACWLVYLGARLF